MVMPQCRLSIPTGAISGAQMQLAEDVGFEPTVPFPVRRFKTAVEKH